MKLITAIIRNFSLEKIITGLNKIGVKGITISEVKGRGEEVILYRHYSIHNKIEIILPDNEVDKAIKTILDLAQTGERGDGVITVQEVKELIRIRTKETLK